MVAFDVVVLDILMVVVLVILFVVFVRRAVETGIFGCVVVMGSFNLKACKICSTGRSEQLEFKAKKKGSIKMICTPTSTSSTSATIST